MADNTTAASYPPIQDEMLAQLDSSHPLRVRGASAPIVARRTLADRTLEHPNWTGVRFDDALIEAVEFTGGTLRQLRFEKGHLDGVVMRGTSLKKVTFVGVTLRNLTCVGIRLEQCLFKQCKLSNTRFEQATFEDCTFEGCSMEDVYGPTVTLRRSTFVDCRMESVRWSEGTLSDVTWHGGRLHKSRWTLCRTEQVRFDATELNQLTLLGGSHASLVFHKVHGAHLALSEAELGTLRFDACPSLEDLRVVSCHSKSLVVAQAPRVVALLLSLSELDHMAISRSTVAHLDLDEMRISAGMVVRETRLHGLKVGESSVTGLGLEQVHFSGYISVRTSQLYGMRGRKVSVERGLERNLSGVTYTGCSLTFEDIHV